jgi:hypothetical protein
MENKWRKRRIEGIGAEDEDKEVVDMGKNRRKENEM